jgi:hypothetical protein
VPSAAAPNTGVNTVTGECLETALNYADGGLIEEFSLVTLAALFCYIERELGRPQRADAGMHLQTVMLLLRTEELHSCPQMAWLQVRETVAEVLSPSDRLILFCGMTIGYEDPR